MVFGLIRKKVLFSFDLQISSIGDEITNVHSDARYIIPGENNVNVTDVYEIEKVSEEGKIVVKKLTNLLVKDKSSRVLKINTITTNKTYIDNNLRYEVTSISNTDTQDLNNNSQEINETFIDVNGNAVIRKIIYKTSKDVQQLIDIKYYEVEDYNAELFDNINTYSIRKREIMRETDEETFNEFVNGGNNLSPFL